MAEEAGRSPRVAQGALGDRPAKSAAECRDGPVARGEGACGTARGHTEGRTSRRQGRSERADGAELLSSVDEGAGRRRGARRGRPPVAFLYHYL